MMSSIYVADFSSGTLLVSMDSLDCWGVTNIAGTAGTDVYVIAWLGPGIQFLSLGTWLACTFEL